MGLWDKLKAELIDIVEWLDDFAKRSNSKTSRWG